MPSKVFVKNKSKLVWYKILSSLEQGLPNNASVFFLYVLIISYFVLSCDKKGKNGKYMKVCNKSIQTVTILHTIDRYQTFKC